MLGGSGEVWATNILYWFNWGSNSFWLAKEVLKFMQIQTRPPSIHHKRKELLILYWGPPPDKKSLCITGWLQYALVPYSEAKKIIIESMSSFPTSILLILELSAAYIWTKQHTTRHQLRAPTVQQKLKSLTMRLSSTWNHLLYYHESMRREAIYRTSIIYKKLVIGVKCSGTCFAK